MNQMKVIIILMVSLLLFTFVTCSSPDVVSPDVDLKIKGSYNGDYILTNSSDSVFLNINIDLIFRDFTYELNDTIAVICSPKGEYTIYGDTINLNEKFIGKSICDPIYNPNGEFTFTLVGDTLILDQYKDSVFAEILLIKKP